MSWVMVGTAVVGAVQGGEKAKQANKMNKASAESAAAQTAASPWSGMGQGEATYTDPGGGALMGGLQGGLSGYMMDKKNPGMFGADEKPELPAAPAMTEQEFKMETGVPTQLDASQQMSPEQMKRFGSLA